MNADEQERNCLLVFQIPLKQKYQPIRENLCMSEKRKCVRKFKATSDSLGMDDAMLRTGASHSTFIGINNKSIERDPEFPIRCTVQFYKVTDTDVIPESAFQEMSEKINHIYKYGVAQGSLVTSGNTGRTTEWVK